MSEYTMGCRNEKEFRQQIEDFNRRKSAFIQVRNELSRYMDEKAADMIDAGYAGHLLMGVMLPSGPQAILVEESEVWDGARYGVAFLELVDGDHTLVQSRTLITGTVERHADGTETRRPFSYRRAGQ